MPGYTIQVLNVSCANTAAQSKETSSATGELSMVPTVTVIANTSARSKTANTVLVGSEEALEDDWITPNDMSRYMVQRKMRQYYKEIKLQRQCESYEGSW